MTPRERVLAVLHGKAPDRIPCFDDFFDIDAEEKFIPAYAGLIARGTRPAQRHNPEQMVEMLRFLDRDIAEAGSARLRVEVIKKSENEEIVRYENGAVWRYTVRPACSEPLALPLDNGGDPESIYMPDPSEPERYRQIGEDIAFFKEQGYFTMVKLHGFFSGAHYLFRRFEDLLMDMAADEPYAEAIIRRVGEYTLACAGEVLKRGADCIFIGDDLGSSLSLLISPAMYRRFIQPWHARLAKLCHAHNAFLHVHSHGHILPVIDNLMDAGIDMMDPLGPSDGIDLDDLLPRCRGRMVIAGGISKFIGRMSLEELDAHLKEVISIGARHGGFILRSEGGIPPDMSREAFEFYLARGRRYRELSMINTDKMKGRIMLTRSRNKNMLNSIINQRVVAGRPLKELAPVLAALLISLPGVGITAGETANQQTSLAPRKAGDAIAEDKSFLGDRERYEIRKRKFSNPEGKNLIYNGSFELGTYGWELRHYHDNWRSWVREIPGTNEMRWQMDGATSYDGTSSLLVEGKTDEQSKINLVSFRTILRAPEKAYTFSFFMKGSGLKATVGDKTFTPTKDWQRYFTVLKGLKQYYPAIQFEGAGKVWLDAIQLEEGTEPTAFSMSSRLEFGLLTDKEDNIYYSGEKLILRFYLHNGKDKTAQGKVVYAVKNFNHEIVAEGSFPFKLDSFQRKEEAGEINLHEKGIFWVRTVLLEEGAGDRDMEMNFAVISPVKGKKDPFFGMCQWEANDPEKQFKIAKDMGAGFFMPYGPFYNSAAPEDWKEKAGKFNKDIVPYALELSRKYDIPLIGMFGGVPSWYSCAGGERIWSYSPATLKKLANITDPERMDWSDFVFTTADTFKRGITAWEIWGEVNGEDGKDQAATTTLMSFLKPAYDSIKRADTNLLVVGNSFCGNPKIDAERMFQRGALDCLDVVSIHRHQNLFNNNALECSGGQLEQFKDLMKKYGKEKPLWNTETGRQAINIFYEDISYGENPSIMTIGSEEEQAERIVKINIISKAHGVQKFGTFMINGVSGNNRPFLWGMTIGACREPKASIPAYNTMASLLSHTAFVEEIKGIKDIRCYVFKQEKSGHNAPLWDKIKSYVFKREKNKYIAVLWDKSELQQDKWRKMELLVPSIPGEVKVIDLMGNQIMPETKEGKISLHLVGGSPVFMIAGENPSSYLAKTEAIEGKKGITLGLDLKNFSSLSNRIEARILNSEQEKAACDVEVKKVPSGWEPRDSWKQKTEIEGKSEATVDFYLKNAQISTGEKNYEIEVKVHAGKENVSATLKPVFCPFVQSSPNIDGDLSEWSNSVPLVLGKESAVSSLALLESDREREQRINSARVWLGWDKDFFYFACEVTDNVFNQPYDGEMIWAGDSIQIGFVPLHNAVRGCGYGEEDREYGLVLTKSGPCVYRWQDNKSGIAKEVKSAVKRNGQKTYYEAAFPWSSLAPFCPDKGSKMGFSFVIMDNDGEEKAQNWLALTHGVAGRGGKRPFLFKDLFFLKQIR